MAVRSGDEPTTARSPLRLRRVLSLWGLLWAVVGTVAFVLLGEPGWAAAGGVLALICLLDLLLVLHRMRQGPHWQPGPEVPPYHPPDPGPRKPGAPPRGGAPG
ncbi:DUF6343 family protein [Streptomyces sp. BI20]|uniref:DUF6343 family protein n=1 Tax=Streptomyces sp. BI20 TaxID=3403460 RepID=UPI003C7485EB